MLSAAQLLAGPWGQLRPDQVHVVLDMLPGSPRRAARGLAARLGDHGHPAHRPLMDRHLAAGAHINLDLPAEPTQLRCWTARRRGGERDRQPLGVCPVPSSCFVR